MTLPQLPVDTGPTSSDSDKTATSGYKINNKWIFDPLALTLKVDGELCTMRRKNIEVLKTLTLNHNQMVSNEDLYLAVWGKSCVSEGVIKRSICDLRNFFDDKDKSMIMTVPRQGYKLCVEVETYDIPIESNENDSSLKSKIIETVNPPTAPVEPVASIERPVSSKPTKRPGSLVHMCWFVITLISCGIVMMTQSPTTNQSEQTTSSDSLLLRQLANQIKSPEQVTQVLADVSRKLYAMELQNPLRHSLAVELISAYSQFEMFEQAIAMNKKLALGSEKLYGRFDKKTMLDNQLLVDTLLLAKRTQASFDLARMNLENALEHHGNDTNLVANSYIRFAHVNLKCLYPKCDSSDTLNNGLSSTEKAIELLQDANKTDSIVYADALFLKNWFIHDFAQKYQLMTQSLAIYLDKIGHYDQRTADVYLQLGRLQSLWEGDDNNGIDNIKQALSIYQFLYGDYDDSTRYSKYILGQGLVAEGLFDQAITYLSQIVTNDQPASHCKAFDCLKALVALTKAYLYQGNTQKAQELTVWLSLANGTDPNKIPFSLAQEIKNVQLKIQSTKAEIAKTEQHIKKAIEQNRINSKAASNHYALYSITHELQHQQLRYMPQSLDIESYMETLSKLFVTTIHAYFSSADKDYLLKRAAKYCANHSDELCSRLQSETFVQVQLARR